jgi:hypothetical protein
MQPTAQVVGKSGEQTSPGEAKDWLSLAHSRFSGSGNKELLFAEQVRRIDVQDASDWANYGELIR